MNNIWLENNWFIEKSLDLNSQPNLRSQGSPKLSNIFEKCSLHVVVYLIKLVKPYFFLLNNLFYIIHKEDDDELLNKSGNHFIGEF